MYLPKHFEECNEDLILEIANEYPFATIMSFDESNRPFFNHVPVLIERKTNGFALLGHVARRNPQWSHFQKNAKAKIIFHGPSAYITPKWYRSGHDVPTWNYVVLHMDGTARLFDDFDGLVNLLKALTEKFEGSSPEAWEFELPEGLRSPDTLCSAIVGFEINVEKIDAKFKLSQNRVAIDKLGVIEGLSQRGDDMSRAIRSLMMKG